MIEFLVFLVILCIILCLYLFYTYKELKEYTEDITLIHERQIYDLNTEISAIRQSLYRDQLEMWKSCTDLDNYKTRLYLLELNKELDFNEYNRLHEYYNGVINECIKIKNDFRDKWER